MERCSWASRSPTATRAQRAHELPRFLQGAFEFEGRGLTEPTPLDGGLSYTVPSDRRGQLAYFRGELRDRDDLRAARA